jgi:hypothetical protein
MASLPINRLPSDVEMPESPEKARILNRRKRTRAQLHWPLSFALTGTAETVQTITQDLSSDGFYCIANARFVPGEARHCTLLVPTHHPGGENSPLHVLCKVRIIRVEVTGERGFYGVGCQIMDYRLVNSARGVELQGALDGADTEESGLNVSNRDL